MEKIVSRQKVNFHCVCDSVSKMLTLLRQVRNGDAALGCGGDVGDVNIFMNVILFTPLSYSLHTNFYETCTR
jgi:hypothetical protein